MNKMTMFKVYVSDQEAAKRHYIDQLGFELAEDQMFGDYRWLTVCVPGDTECCINLEIAKTTEQKALMGRQAADQPLFGLGTANCWRDYFEMKHRGVNFLGEPKAMPYGIGVML